MVRRSEYELVFIVHPSLDGDEGVPAVTEKVKGWIEAVGGEVTYTDFWGRRRLSYTIQNQTVGWYVLVRAIMPHQALTDLERELKLSEEIIRYLLVRAETPLPSRRPSGSSSRPARSQERRPSPEDEDEDSEEDEELDEDDEDLEDEDLDDEDLDEDE